MPDYPRAPAAFINAIAEEGARAEAAEWLQKQRNETCALRPAATLALFEMRHTVAPRNSFTDAVDALDAALNHKESSDV